MVRDDERVRIDLRRIPPLPRYALALAVAAAVAVAAWSVGKDDPVPGWVGDRLVPVLGWLWIAAVVFLAARRLRRGRAAGKDGAP